MSDAIQAGTVLIPGAGGDEIEAYLATPESGPGEHGSVVVIHHLPGYDRATKEIVRRFAAEGFAAICPNLYYREAPGASPDDAAAYVRARGGVPDERVAADVAACAEYLKNLPGSNGKVGVIGYCSGGRHTFLCACTLPIDAAVDCYGAFVIDEPPAGFPVAMRPLIGLAPDLGCPLLGIFGEDDANPAPDEVARLSAELDRLGKPHEFHSYPGAGHAFFAVDRPAYRPEAAVDAWDKVLGFLHRHLDDPTHS